MRLPTRALALLVLAPLAAFAQTVLPEFEGRAADRTVDAVFSAPGLRAAPGGAAREVVAEFDVPLEAGQVLRATLVSSGPGAGPPGRLDATTPAGAPVEPDRGSVTVVAEVAGTVRLVATGLPNARASLRVTSFLPTTLTLDTVPVGPGLAVPSDGTVRRSAATALSFLAEQGRPVLLAADSDDHLDPALGDYRRDFDLFVFDDGGYERGRPVVIPVPIVESGPSPWADGVLWVPAATGRSTVLVSERGRPDATTAQLALFGVTNAAQVPADTLAAWGARRTAARAAAGCPALTVDLRAGTVNGLVRPTDDESRALACPADRDRSALTVELTRGVASLSGSWIVYAKTDAAVEPDVFGQPAPDALRLLGLAPGREVRSDVVSRPMPYGCLRLHTNVFGDVYLVGIRHGACPDD